MKAAFYTELGEPEVLHCGDLPNPECGETDIALDVKAISVEGGDLLHRRITPVGGPHRVSGYQAAGIVSKVGSKISRLRPGDRIIGFSWLGSHADTFVVPQDFAYPVPEGLDLRVAALVPIAFGTAHEALFEYGSLKAGDTILIKGVTGDVCTAMLQLAKQAGASLFGTTSSADKQGAILDLGLDQVIDPTSENVRAKVMDLTGGVGVDLVFDLVGGPGFAALRPPGKIVLIGVASGTPPQIDSAGTLTVPIDRGFALGDAVAAHRHIEQERSFGRVLLIP